MTVRRKKKEEAVTLSFSSLTWTAFRGSIETFGSENEAPESMLLTGLREREKALKKRKSKKRSER